MAGLVPHTDRKTQKDRGILIIWRIYGLIEADL